MNNPIPDQAPERDFASPIVERKRRRPSLIWLMPLLALAISAAVVWNNYAQRGPLVTITFNSASGISAGTTEVRIRDLRVGVVEKVGFADGMGAVEAQIRFDKEIARYVDQNANFWLVEPTVTARGVSGIGTLLSGVYIAADWDGIEGVPTDRFSALEIPPLSTSGEDGTRIILRARAGGQLAAGAPVLTSGIEVGRIGQPTLSDSGATVTMEAFIFAPYNRRLTTNARFWDASGLSFNLGAQGLALKVDSLAALLEGGVTFGNPVTGGDLVSEGHVYDVFSSEQVARADAFEEDSNPDIPVSLLLDTDVNGLSLDTLVRFKGIKVGEVVDIVGIPPEEGSDDTVKLRIDLRLSRARLAIPKNLLAGEVSELLEERTANGLRARLGAEGLFGQTVIIELVNLTAPPPAKITLGPDNRIFLPMAPPALSDPESGMNGLVERVSNLPIEELMNSATQALANVSRLTTTAEGVLAADGMDEIPQKIDSILSEARTLITEVREGGAIENLNSTLKRADTALQSVNEDVGATLADLRSILGKVNEGGAVENFNTMLKSADNALKSVNGAVESTLNEAEKLLADLRTGGAIKSVNETLAEVRTLITELREGGAIENLNATLKSADSALQSVDGVVASTLVEVQTLIKELREGGAIENLNATLKSADSALQSVDSAVSTLPALAKRLNATADNLQAVVSGYDTNSRFYGDVRAVLKDISSTADSFRSLARSIERNPSSIITGRR
jgi:paraquat-inducible protein B